MLLSILTIYSYIGSTDFQLLSLYEINTDFQKILWLSLPFSKVDMTSGIFNKKKLSNLSKFTISNRKK